MVKQKPIYIDACDVANAFDKMADQLKKMNESGYKLTSFHYQSDEGISYKRTTAILIFDKDE